MIVHFQYLYTGYSVFLIENSLTYGKIYLKSVNFIFKIQVYLLSISSETHIMERNLKFKFELVLMNIRGLFYNINDD